jgi:purine-nucleoside phosphorylase
MKALGINTIVVTNACGGMNPAFKAGDLMFISDHINFMWSNPLMGPNMEELGPRFPDVARAYTKELLELGKKVGTDLGIETKIGVYCGISGPSFMTPAELKMLRLWGADAVGMSTVPEVITAAHMSMKVLGLACITDMAIAETLEPIDHETVMKMALQTKPKFLKLVKAIIKQISL